MPFKDEEARATLRRLASDPESDVRGHAIWAIGRNRDPLAIPILLQVLDDEGGWKRCEKRGFMWTLYYEPIACTSNDSLARITGHRVKLAYDASGPERLAAKRNWETFLVSWKPR